MFDKLVTGTVLLTTFLVNRTVPVTSFQHKRTVCSGGGINLRRGFPCLFISCMLQ